MPVPSHPKRPALCAMIHVGALPGTPRDAGSLRAVIDAAAAEARLLARAGVDSVMIENMHDTPYVRGGVGPEIVAAMTAVGIAVKQEIGSLPLGAQVLAGANREALAVALASGADFVRVEGFVFAHVGDEGTHESCAGDLLRYRRAIGATGIAVMADIKKKHSSHAITADVSLAETAHAAEFFGADGVIVTGSATGRAADVEDLRGVKSAVGIPVAVGSGITAANAGDYASADLFIVGSAFKREGHWANAIDERRLEAIVQAVKALAR